MSEAGRRCHTPTLSFDREILLDLDIVLFLIEMELAIYPT